MTGDVGVRQETVSKVAEITLAFWIMKILATTLGETAGDYLSMSLGLGYYVGLAITFAILVVVLAVQVGSHRYHPLLFWLAIISTTTAGTEISDFMDRSLGFGYMLGSALLVTGLLLTLLFWYARTGNLAVYPMIRKDSELFFWLAVLFSNSLGTAFGDFLTDNMALTFLQGAAITAGIIFIVGALHYSRSLPDALLFWIAFVFTRPFGATFGDFLTKPTDVGGLALPRDYASLTTLGLLLAILYLSTNHSAKRGR